MDRQQSTIKKVLIANRGEVALRIQATCHAWGLKTVAVYTQEDQHRSYVFQATNAYQLPKNGGEGYIDQNALIEIAKKSHADAVHPGYGFLSENAQFAQRVIDAGLTWIGPTPENIALLADKAESQTIMRNAGVPTIPGYAYKSDDPDAPEHARDAANRMGFPVMIKCAHAGGGKAMQCVHTYDEFESAWNSVVYQARKLFNSSTILVEKQIINPRHIEVQVAGDTHNVIHLYERECSLQRHHQKIIEEASCAFINAEMKEKLFQAAIRAAQAVNYQSIGTVEFLVTADQSFYFLEMNTRLQVEHSITEQITGIDLVHLQLVIAATGKLPYSQENIRQHGHAIECRLYSEDPSNHFAPSTGTITNLTLPNAPFLRIDHDLEEKMAITPFFDPMLAKFTTWSDTRRGAIAHMLAALARTNISGIKTNTDFLRTMLQSTQFATGAIHTQLLQKALNESHNLAPLTDQPAPPPEFSSDDLTRLATLFLEKQEPEKKSSSQPSRWKDRQWK